MSVAQDKIDPPDPRVDLVLKAANSDFKSDFDWINDTEALRVTEDPKESWLDRSRDSGVG